MILSLFNRDSHNDFAVFAGLRKDSQRDDSDECAA
jgi:hypothetical protein